MGLSESPISAKAASDVDGRRDTGWQLDVHEKGDGGVGRHRDVVSPGGAVLPDDRETAPVEVLDRRDIDAPRVTLAPGGERGVSQAGDETPRGRLVGDRHPGHEEARAGPDDGQTDLGDDPERALRTDKEIDEIHLRFSEVSGRALSTSGIR